MPKGTCVTLIKLFYNTPVRRQSALCMDMNLMSTHLKNAAKNTAATCRKVSDLVTSYALVHPEIRVSLKFENEGSGARGKKGAADIIKISVGDPIAAIQQIYGSTMRVQLSQFDAELPIRREHPDLDEDVDAEVLNGLIRVEGILPLSTADAAAVIRSVPDREFVYVNHRPVSLSSDQTIKRLLSAVRERCLKQLRVIETAKKYPFLWLHIIMPPSTTDFNVEPDKTTVLIHHPERLLEVVETLLDKAYPPPASKIPEEETQIEETGTEDIPMKPPEAELLPEALSMSPTRSSAVLGLVNGQLTPVTVVRGCNADIAHNALSREDTDSRLPEGEDYHEAAVTDRPESRVLESVLNKDVVIDRAKWSSGRNIWDAIGQGRPHDVGGASDVREFIISPRKGSDGRERPKDLGAVSGVSAVSPRGELNAENREAYDMRMTKDSTTHAPKCGYVSQAMRTTAEEESEFVPQHDRVIDVDEEDAAVPIWPSTKSRPNTVSGARLIVTGMKRKISPISTSNAQPTLSDFLTRSQKTRSSDDSTHATESPPKKLKMQPERIPKALLAQMDEEVTVDVNVNTIRKKFPTFWKRTGEKLENDGAKISGGGDVPGRKTVDVIGVVKAGEEEGLGKSAGREKHDTSRMHEVALFQVLMQTYKLPLSALPMPKFITASALRGPDLMDWLVQLARQATSSPTIVDGYQRLEVQDERIISNGFRVYIRYEPSTETATAELTDIATLIPGYEVDDFRHLVRSLKTQDARSTKQPSPSDSPKKALARSRPQKVVQFFREQAKQLADKRCASLNSSEETKKAAERFFQVASLPEAASGDIWLCPHERVVGVRLSQLTE
ncbi:ATP-binding mismatch repair protein [Borealophlyctis nickersoniae]|nr:ATP-binding mismatch repair protein [Borealophlyctis nickersoniae]